MARRGDVLVLPQTGARLVFLETSAETDGRVMRFEYFLPPGAVIAESHLHPRQEERMQVVAGTMTGHVRGAAQTARAGAAVVVLPGTPHAWGNGGASEAHVVVEFRPALRSETFLETVFEMAAQGDTDDRGVPTFWLRALLAAEFSDEFVPASLPRPLAELSVRVLARIARLRGRRLPATDARVEPAS